YQKLYDYTADAVKRALPSARLGGPHSTGPSSDQAADFLRRFLEHCARGTNFATGRTGSPLDYVGFHAKGRPPVVEGRVQMGISKQLQDISRGFEIAASFPEFRSLPIIIGESDPEGCAACSARGYPQNAYRNGALYPAYSAAVFRGTLDLAQRHRVNLQGALTWAFEFEDQPYFDGFGTLATNGVDKPVLNVFRMLGMMRGERIKAESSGGVDLDGMMRNGVQGKPAIDVLATRDGRQISILVWDYHDDDVPGPAADVEVDVGGLPGVAKRVLWRHYRIDEHHSNGYTVWKNLGSPQKPSPEEYARLVEAGQLQLLQSPEWGRAANGHARLEFSLPRQGVSLLQLNW